MDGGKLPPNSQFWAFMVDIFPESGVVEYIVLIALILSIVGTNVRKVAILLGWKALPAGMPTIIVWLLGTGMLPVGLA